MECLRIEGGEGVSHANRRHGDTMAGVIDWKSGTGMKGTVELA